MAAKPLTSEAIALTEKKMDMALDDIIKMSKNNSSKIKKRRAPNKSQSVFSGNPSQRNATKVRRFLDTRSSIRQGFLAQRRSNFQKNQFPIAAEVARKAAAAPIRNRPFNTGRIANRNQNRVRALPIQRKASGGGFSVKLEQSKFVPNQKPHTLDARFASLREQRMKSLPTHNNGKQVGGGQQRFQRGRGRFGN